MKSIKMLGRAGAIVAAVFAAIQVGCEIMSRCLGFGSFYRTDFLTGIYIGVGACVLSLVILAVVALMTIATCFLAEVCSKRMPALETFFENIAKALASQLKD